MKGNSVVEQSNNTKEFSKKYSSAFKIFIITLLKSKGIAIYKFSCNVSSNKNLNLNLNFALLRLEIFYLVNFSYLFIYLL